MTRPSLADIESRIEERRYWQGWFHSPARVRTALASAADVPDLLAAVRDVLAVADQFDRLAARHPDSETGQTESAAAHEIRSTLTARLDLTDPEGDPT